MKLDDGRITMLASRDNGFTIELKDGSSITTFAEVHLTADQFISAMSRIAHIPCTIKLNRLDRVGKKHEHKNFEFEIFEVGLLPYKEKQSVLIQMCHQEMDYQELTEFGWISDNHFNSQHSFFQRGNKNYAQTTIRRWK